MLDTTRWLRSGLAAGCRSRASRNIPIVKEESSQTWLVTDCFKVLIEVRRIELQRSRDKGQYSAHKRPVNELRVDEIGKLSVRYMFQYALGSIPMLRCACAARKDMITDRCDDHAVITRG